MEKIRQRLYQLNWYEWDVNSAKTLHIMLMNTSIPLNWNAITPSQSINYGYFKEVRVLGSIYRNIFEQKTVMFQYINFLYSTGRLFYSVFYQNN